MQYVYSTVYAAAGERGRESIYNDYRLFENRLLSKKCMKCSILARFGNVFFFFFRSSKICYADGGDFWRLGPIVKLATSPTSSGDLRPQIPGNAAASLDVILPLRSRPGSQHGSPQAIPQGNLHRVRRALEVEGRRREGSLSALGDIRIVYFNGRHADIADRAREFAPGITKIIEDAVCVTRPN